MDGAAYPDARCCSGLPECLLFLVCGAGLNITLATYLAHASACGAGTPPWSEPGWLSAGVYGAASAAVLVQVPLGRRLTERFGSKVFALGALIGVFEGCALSALQQLAALVHCDMTRYVNTGFALAQAMPTVLPSLVGLQDAQASCAAIVASAWAPMLLCLSAAVLFVAIVYSRGSFNAVFLSRDLRCQDPGWNRIGVVAHHKSGVAVYSSTAAPFARSKRDAETCMWLLRWEVLACAGMVFTTQALSVLFVTFFAYFGTLELVRMLALVRFGSELAGRCAAHPCGLGWWGHRGAGGIRLLAWLAVVRAVILSAVLLGVVDFGHGLLLGVLAAFTCLTSAWSQSEVLALAVGLVPGERGPELAQGMVLLSFASQFLSLGLAFQAARHLAPPGRPHAGGFALVA